MTERIEIKKVRGETFLPKEKMITTIDEVNNRPSEIFGKYCESVPGVIDEALLLDGFTLIKIGQELIGVFISKPFVD